jgi:hypothetical protein
MERSRNAGALECDFKHLRRPDIVNHHVVMAWHSDPWRDARDDGCCLLWGEVVIATIDTNRANIYVRGQ